MVQPTLSPLIFTYRKQTYKIDPSVILGRYHHLIGESATGFILEFLYGGRDSSKSYTTAELLVIECLFMQSFRCALICEEANSVKDAQWQLIKDIVDLWKLSHLFEFRKSPLEIECVINGNKFIARGCDEPLKLKNITACNRAWIEEGVKDKESLDTILGTLRSSTTNIKIFYSFNPEFKGDYHKWWIFEDWFAKYWSLENLSFDGVKKQVVKLKDKRGIYVEREIELKYRVTHSDYHCNPFVSDERRAIHENRKGHDYTVYTQGYFGYLKSGGEYLPMFKADKHTDFINYDPLLPLHISVDSNTAPYVAISIWQIDEEKKELRQWHELPCRSPNASGTRAARQLSNYLTWLKYDNVIMLYGDSTANNKSTVDENNKSFFDKFRDELRHSGWVLQDHIGKTNPRVGLSGDFLNDIFEGKETADGWKIIINKTCAESIEDYTMSKLAKNGGIDKKMITDKETGVTYQQRGHMLDCMKYMVCKVLSDTFEKFGNRKKRGFLGVGQGNFRVRRENRMQ